jgi:hypothetical protein
VLERRTSQPSGSPVSLLEACAEREPNVKWLRVRCSSGPVTGSMRPAMPLSLPLYGYCRGWKERAVKKGICWDSDRQCVDFSGYAAIKERVVRCPPSSRLRGVVCASPATKAEPALCRRLANGFTESDDSSIQNDQSGERVTCA